MDEAVRDVRDIIVTTPKSCMADAAQEAEDAKQYGGHTRYFRRFSSNFAPGIGVGDRVYYVEDGYIRGFAVVCEVTREDNYRRCDTTGNLWRPGVYVWMRADSWQWIKPIPMRGFQQWRVIGAKCGERAPVIKPEPDSPSYPVEIVGGWLNPKPAVDRQEVMAL